MHTIEETDDRFYIDSSRIPNAGYGLFAKVPIKSGDWLEVIGVLVKRGGVADQCTHYARRYKFAGKEGWKIVPCGYAGIVNHSDDKSLQNCELRNTKGLPKRSTHSSEVAYHFTRDLEVGEEVVGNYGADIGGEVNKVAENLKYYYDNELEWKKFLEFNLYNLTSIKNLLL